MIARRAVAVRAATVICFAAAVFSKESAMTLLLVVPAMDAIVPARRADGRSATPASRLLADYLSLLAVAVGYLLARHAVLGGILIADRAIAPLDNPLVPIATMPLGERMGATAPQAFMTAIAVLAEYARVLVWPARLSPDYSYNQLPIVTSVGDARFVAGLALVIGGILALVLLWRRHRVAAFGLTLFALTFSLVSNFVIHIGTIFAERLVYLPSAGLCIAAGAGCSALAGSDARRRRAIYGAVGLLLVAAAARAWIRNRDWRDDETLWSKAVQTSPRSARVQTEYGRVLMTRAEGAAAAGRADEAERLYAEARAHLATAVSIYPSYSLALDELAMIESQHQRYDEATALYQRAIKAWPGNYGSLTNLASLQLDQANAIGRRAIALRNEGKIAESDATFREADAVLRSAIETIDRAIAAMPTYPQAHLVRAMILAGPGADPQGAVAEFQQVLRLEPTHPQRAVIEAELQRLASR
jgi:tetratricopeptide (TPR) repeat protein